MNFTILASINIKSMAQLFVNECYQESLLFGSMIQLILRKYSKMDLEIYLVVEATWHSRSIEKIDQKFTTRVD